MPQTAREVPNPGANREGKGLPPKHEHLHMRPLPTSTSQPTFIAGPKPNAGAKVPTQHKFYVTISNPTITHSTTTYDSFVDVGVSALAQYSTQHDEML